MKKNQPVKVPDDLVVNVQKILDKYSAKNSSAQGQENIFSEILKPIIEFGKKNYERYQKGKEDYRIYLETSVTRLDTTEKKNLFLENERSQLEKLIIYYRNLNYTGHLKQTIYLKANILLPYIEIVERESILRKHISLKIDAKNKIGSALLPKKPEDNKSIFNMQFETYIKVVDDLIALGKFLKNDRKALLNAYYSLNNQYKIIFHGNGNALLTILYDLKINNKIKANKKILAQWVLWYFVFQPEQNSPIVNFKGKSVYETFNKAQHRRRVHSSSPKYIDILKIIENRHV